MTNKKYVFLALITFTGVVMLFADFVILVFFGHPLSRIFVPLGIPSVAFLIIYCVVLGRHGRYFDVKEFKDIPGDVFTDRLKKAGSVPIKMIALNTVLHALFLSGVFFRNEYLGLDSELKSALFLAALSFGMLVGTFVYVVNDGLVSRFLVSLNFTDYPKELRENRQELKAFIIPLAASLTSLVFSSAVTLLGADKSGAEGSSAAILIPIIIFFICIGILAYNLKKNTSVIYNSITKQCENLSSDQKDLTQRIYVCSVDELGTITGMVNTFCEHLSGGIRDIKSGQHELSKVGTRMEENASVMADSIARVSGAAEQVLAKTQGQIESVNTTTKTVKEIAGLIETMEKSVITQTSSMSQGSEAVEKMVGNISSISLVTEKMAAQFETVGEAAEEGSRIQKQSRDRIREIVEQSQALQEANKIIATIAAQTNLLSMNAAIEAAHAGESGRGFSVVADEIRKLAENSSSESKKINAELKQIMATINHIVKDAEASGNAFAEVSKRIGETEKLVIEVDNAIREQKSGAGQVMESLKEMNDISARVSSDSHAMGQSNQVMLQEISVLQGSAADIETQMEKISGGIKKLNTGAQDVSHMAAATQASIEKISTIADGFQV
ncbi:MAG: methyl-accepting chemotaxis protein [Treponema sp.]|jgi:methyl-accepting chemotaxis protein|nr:methyl-accepting chemotaxis protein [Treponema sp.]